MNIGFAQYAKVKVLEAIKYLTNRFMKPITELENLPNQDLTQIISNWKDYPSEYIAVAVHVLNTRNFYFGEDGMSGMREDFCKHHKIYAFGDFILKTVSNYGVQLNQPTSSIQDILDVELIREAGYSLKNIVTYTIISIVCITIAVIAIMSNPRNTETIYMLYSLAQVIIFIIILVAINNAGNKLVKSVKTKRYYQ